MSQKPTVLLLSGGIESVTLLHLLADSGKIQPLFFNYAQRAVQPELDASKKNCDALGIDLQTLDLKELGNHFRQGEAWQPHVPLPHRNLILLSIALSFASKIQAHRLCLALNREDADYYATGTPAFIQHFQALTAEISSIRTETPLIKLDKAQIIHIGHQELGIDYAKTYSCLLGRTRPCGKCPQCLKRLKAFKIAGLDDPAPY
ncbi:7-cyano-7-deazaguanine synthase [Acidihalobacter prosperus]